MSYLTNDEYRDLRRRRWLIYARGCFFSAHMAILRARVAAYNNPDTKMEEVGHAVEMHRRARYGLARMRTA